MPVQAVELEGVEVLKLVAVEISVTCTVAGLECCEVSVASVEM